MSTTSASIVRGGQVALAERLMVGLPLCGQPSEGGGPGRDGRARGRHQGADRDGGRLPGVVGVLGRPAAGLPAPGHARPDAGAIGDGALGFWNAINEVFSEARHQRCWVHKAANCLDSHRKRLNAIFCGIDWAEGHHDIALVDQDGSQLAKLRISDDSAGFHELMELLVRHGDTVENPIPVAIETPRGLLVAGLPEGRSSSARRQGALGAVRHRSRRKGDQKDLAPGRSTGWRRPSMSWPSTAHSRDEAALPHVPG